MVSLLLPLRLPRCAFLQVEEDRLGLDDANKTRVRELAADFPRLWHHPRTPHRERKRMARLLIEDVTLVRDPDRQI